MFAQYRTSFFPLVLLATLVVSPLTVPTQTLGAARTVAARAMRGGVNRALPEQMVEYGFSLVDLVADNPWTSGLVATSAVALIVCLSVPTLRNGVKGGFGYAGKGLSSAWNGTCSAAHWTKMYYLQSRLHGYSDAQRLELLKQADEQVKDSAAYQLQQKRNELKIQDQKLALIQEKLKQFNDSSSGTVDKTDASSASASSSSLSSSSSSSSSSASSGTVGSVTVEPAFSAELNGLVTTLKCTELLVKEQIKRDELEQNCKNLERLVQDSRLLYANDTTKKFGLSTEIADKRDALNVQKQAAFRAMEKSRTLENIRTFERLEKAYGKCKDELKIIKKKTDEELAAVARA